MSSSPDGLRALESNGNGSASHNGHVESLSLNGTTNRHASVLPPTASSTDELDLLCVGFGPASLAIAIALYDSVSTSTSTSPSRSAPKALFLEKQPQFAWHAGMQLPGAKMQISFLKDLATPRCPTSSFTFLNYLYSKGRLNHFINLGTFLPSRLEYEDYLRWCASRFEAQGVVRYSSEVSSVEAGARDASGKITSWSVSTRDAQTGELVTRTAKNVVIAVGGKPTIPPVFQGLKHVFHSSQFATNIGRIEAESQERNLRFVVVGSGQSAAEIFNDLSERFAARAEVKLCIKGKSLRPSDDSPL